MGTFIICLAIVVAVFVIFVKILQRDAKVQRRCDQVRQEGYDLALRLDVSKPDATLEVNSTFIRFQEENSYVAEAFHKGFMAGMQVRISGATACIDSALDKIDARSASSHRSKS